MLSQHEVCAMERRLKKGWSSETWPNHFASNMSESKSSRKHESHLGKNDGSTKPVRLRTLFPELYEAPSDEEDTDEVSKFPVEDDSSGDLATMQLSACEDDDSVGNSSEDSLEDRSERNMVHTNLCIVPEEVNETNTVVGFSGRKKAPDNVSLGWNVFETSCNKSVYQKRNRSLFAEELQKLYLPLELKKLPPSTTSGVMSSNIKDITKTNGNESHVKNVYSAKPLSVREPIKNRYVISSVNKKRLGFQDIDNSPVVNPGRPKSHSNGSFHTNANKEIVSCNVVEKLLLKCREDTKSTLHNSCHNKMIVSRNGLGNTEVCSERKNDACSMPLRQTVETFLDSSHGLVLSSELNNFSREESADCTKETNANKVACIKCFRKGETEEKGIQCEREKCGRVVECKVQDEAVQCGVETADKCMMADLKLKQEGSAQDSLVVKGNHYKVLSKLGCGGSSTVYQVLDPSTSSLFAVKCVCLPAEQEAIAKGYINEINLLKKLQGNDCIITLHDFEHIPEKEILYVVMEKGDTDLSRLIRDYSSKKRTLSVPMIIYYWTEMLNAVKYIHDHGIIHSDLKPANFLLVCGQLKLIDFGIASSLQSDMTSIFRDSLMGTLNYMSPEAVTCLSSGSPRSKNKYKVSYKSDVWSLGCILYSLIYGKTPFHDIRILCLKFSAITNPATKISFPTNEKCPKILLETLKQCLLFDTKKRPTTAELLAVPYICGGASSV